MLTNRHIFLSGGAWVGKSTLRSDLCWRAGYTAIDVSLSVREMAIRAIFAATGKHITHEEILSQKAYWRPFLQALGTVGGIDDGSLHVRLVENLRLLSGHLPERIVVDQVRTEGQAIALRSIGFVSVELWLPDRERKRRATALGVSDEDYARTVAHPLEQRLPTGVVDISLDSAIPTHEQTNLLEQALTDLKEPLYVPKPSTARAEETPPPA